MGDNEIVANLGKPRTLRESGIGVVEMCLLWMPLEKAFQVGNLSCLLCQVLVFRVIKVARGLKAAGEIPAVPAWTGNG